MARIPAAARAYLHLRQQVLDGSRPPGQLLSEGEVAAELDVSRTPVREAFLRLQAEGFLRLYPKRGAQVVPVPLSAGRDILQARMLLELFAFDSVAGRGNEAVRALGAELTAVTEQHQAAAERGETLQGEAFHTALVAAGGNTVVAGLYTPLWDQQLRLAASAISDPARAAEDAAEHHAIAHALTSGDGAAARILLSEHLTAILRRLGLHDRPLTLPAPPAAAA
ncbi:GntR family transcriptional regulator [Streptomyces sp. NPDC004126]|uniref:GntR family transcriptional regulator n=1 Tax=Streptomyces sp. NPDC004126 TaxID=3390695 RepID=UPI003D027142